MSFHTRCKLGRQPLHEGLGEIEDLLDASPSEVLVLVFEDHIEPELSVQVISEVGLDAGEPASHVWRALAHPE